MINDDDFGISGQPTQILIVEGTETGPRRCWRVIR